MNVLLIEDNPGDVVLIREMLQSRNGLDLSLEAVERLQAGLNRLAAGGVDVVLLDLALAESRGLPTFRSVYEQAPDVPVIVLTGLDDEELAAQAVRQGAQDYLLKGQVDRELLVRAMRYAVERKRAEAATRQARDEWEQTFDAVPDLIMLLDRRHRITRLNRAMAGRLGVSAAEAVGWTCYEAVHGTAAPPAFCPHARLLADGREHAAEVYEERLGGHFWVTCSPLYGTEGQVTGSVHVARDISEQVRAQDLLRAQRDLGLALGAVTGLAETMRLCVEHAIRISDMDCGGIYLVDEPGGGLELAFHLGLSHEFAAFASHYDADSPNARVIASGEPIYTQYATLNLPSDDARRREGLRAAALVPVRHEGRLIACLNVASRTLAAVPEPARGALEAVAAQLGSAIARTKAEAARDRRLGQLALLNDIGRQIVATLAPDELLERAVRLVQERFGYHHVALFTLDQAGAGLHMRARAGLFADRFPAQHRLKVGEGMVGWVGRHGRTLLANDVAVEPHYVNLFPEAVPTRSELAVPVQTGKSILGVLDLQSPELDAFDQNDVMVLETLAGQLAVALENALLYEAAQRELAERERAEVALRCSQAEMALTLDATTDGIWKWDFQTEQLYFSPRWYTMLGYEPDEFPASFESWRALIHPDDVAAALAVAETYLATKPDLYENEFRLRTREGGYRWIHTAARVVERTETGQALRLIGHHQDVTARKQAEMEQERLYRDLQQRMLDLEAAQFQLMQSAKMAAIGELAAGVAHELNNPLTSVLGFSQLLLKNAVLDEEDRQDLAVIATEAGRARDIVRALLDFSRRSESHRQEADVNQIVRDTLALVLRQLEKDGIEIEARYAPDLPLLRLDTGRLKQVCLNLITNAHYAMSRGDRLTVSSQRLADGIALHFVDTGRGIPAENLDHIFEPFFTTKPAGQGTGLGLSISQGIVQEHGGYIEVESQEGRGSAFTLWLPLALALEGGLDD